MCFIMRLFCKQAIEARVFKKRCGQQPYLVDTNLKQTHGTRYSVLTQRDHRFEIIHFGIFKKVLKKLSRRAKVSKIFKKKNVWIFWKPNYPLTKKSKNSRMGKGKGPFLRWSFRVAAHFRLFTVNECRGIHRVAKAVIKLNYKLPLLFYFLNESTTL